MTEREISYKIRGSIFEVYNNLGPGLLESVYEKALTIELNRQGLEVKCQVPIGVKYKGEDLGIGFRADILVMNKVIVEVKSVEELSRFHHKQLLNYLKITHLHLGILVNFNAHRIDQEIVRILNGYDKDTFY